MNHSPHGRNVEESDLAHMVALVLHRACSSMHFSHEVQWGARLADYYFVLATPTSKCIMLKAQKTCCQAYHAR